MTKVYEYKGYKIKKYNNADLLDKDLNGVQWNLYEKGKGPENSSAFEFFSTLKEAKHYIDFIESQVIA